MFITDSTKEKQGKEKQYKAIKQHAQNYRNNAQKCNQL